MPAVGACEAYHRTVPGPTGSWSSEVSRSSRPKSGLRSRPLQVWTIVDGHKC